MIDLRKCRAAAALAGMLALFSQSSSAADAATASTCPALFGYRMHHQENRERRQKLLYWVHQDDEGTIVAHASDRWEIPQGIEFEELSVEATSVARRGRSVEVEISSALADRVECPAGSYRLTVDDSIGEARILAVLPGGVLLELDGTLRYLVARSHHKPRWLMAWGSKYKVYLQRKGSAAARAKPPPRAKPKPKPRKR